MLTVVVEQKTREHKIGLAEGERSRDHTAAPDRVALVLLSSDPPSFIHSFTFRCLSKSAVRDTDPAQDGSRGDPGL